MNILRNAIAWDGACFLVATNLNPVRGTLFDRAGSPLTPEFAIAIEPGYSSWASVGARDGAFGIAYAVDNGANNPKQFRTVQYAGGAVGLISEPIHVADLVPGILAIWSEHGGVCWDGFRWLVGLRLQGAHMVSDAHRHRIVGGEPYGAVAVLREDLSGVLDTTPLTFGTVFAGAPAIVSPIPGGFFDIGFCEGRGGYFGAQFLAGVRGDDHQVVHQTHNGTILGIWWDAGVLMTKIHGAYARGFSIGLTGGIAADYNPVTQTTLVLAKDEGAHLVALELDDTGAPMRELLRLAYWDGIGDYLPSVCAGGGHWLVSYMLRPGAVVRLVKGLEGVPLRELNTHLPDIAPPPVPKREPTIPVTTTVNSPRWAGIFFERNHYIMEPSPAEVAVLVTRPYAPDPWTAFVEAGPPKWVLADYHAIDGVPAIYRLGLNATLEGGPTGPAFGDNEAKRRAVLDGENDFETWWEKRVAKAIALKVPLVFYLDGGFSSDDGREFVRKYLRPRPGLEIIPQQMCYPHREPGAEPEPIAASEQRWRAGLTYLRQAGFRRLAIARTSYTRSDEYPIAHIEQCQPVIDAVANDFQVTFDLAFSWGRESGIAQPHRNDPANSNRAVLEPWLIKRVEEADKQPAPAVLELAPPAPPTPPPPPPTPDAPRTPTTPSTRNAWAEFFKMLGRINFRKIFRR